MTSDCGRRQLLGIRSRSCRCIGAGFERLSCGGEEGEIRAGGKATFEWF